MGNIWSNPRVEKFIRQIRKTAITLNALKINVNSRPPAFLTIFPNLVLTQQTTVSASYWTSKLLCTEKMGI